MAAGAQKWIDVNRHAEWRALGGGRGRERERVRACMWCDGLHAWLLLMRRRRLSKGWRWPTLRYLSRAIGNRPSSRDAGELGSLPGKEGCHGDACCPAAFRRRRTGMGQHASETVGSHSHGISTLLPAGSISCTQCGTWTRTPWPTATGGADDQYLCARKHTQR